MTQNIKPVPRPPVEETLDKVVTPEAVASWTAHDRLMEQQREEERQEEQDRQQIVEAWEQATGTRPTVAEVEAVLKDMRIRRIREAAERNQSQAARQIQQGF